jgi:hypothetical protein
MPISIGHYLNNMSKLTDQWNGDNYKETDRQRIYLKDIDCPPIWHDKLKQHVPPSVFYLNESTGEYGGPGSSSPHEPGVARSGDLMSCLPPAMRADNMMCYIGHEGTYTPSHREMCASLGQNLMVETSGASDEDGKPTKSGSSIWFMTETNDRHLVSEYWLSTLGHDIEVESHFAQINAWKAAPFKTYIVDQRAGDFILIPPLAPHQVWNRGTRTMKAAWNRTTVETLEMALHEALPHARLVCRDEQYKNKAIIHFALEKYSHQLKHVQSQKKSANTQARYALGHSLKIRQLQKDFKRLFALYTEVLLSETLDPVSKSEKKGQYLPYDSFVTCSYCRCNIFNRFLTCTACVAPLENGDEDTYDICMDCYVMGRSCSCLSKYKWVEQFQWQDLVQRHDEWRHLIIDFEGSVNEKSPVSLETEKKNLNKKTLAQVCQDQLKARPFIDPHKPDAVMSAFERRNPWSAVSFDKEDQEVPVDDEGNIKKSSSKKTRAEKLPKGWVMEHVSLYPEVRWKVATCNKCDKSYSYGCLYRMFDLMPRTVMENPAWECPACLKICSCGSCRKKPEMKPHEPTGTVLGHDTKKVADPRSVDSLVNFSLPNLGWIKRVGDDHPHESRRLSRRIDEAERAKAKDPALDENYVDEEENTASISRRPEDLAIDPMLLMDQPAVQTGGGAKWQGGENEYSHSSRRRGGSDNGCERHEEGLGHSVAPVASMLQEDQAGVFTSNGIAYEYPDPTASQSTSTFQPHQFAHPDDGSSKLGPTETSLPHRDIPLPPENSNSGQQLSQLEQMLEEAKRNGQYVSTEATFTGKSLRVTLSLSKSKLAAVLDRPSIPRLSRPLTNGARSGAPVILQSDFPSITHAEQTSVPKKRKSKTETDDDFTARKRKDQKSSTAQALNKDTRKKAVKYTEPSSESEVEEATSFVPVNKRKGPRQLPKYIAQRTQDDEPSPLNPQRQSPAPRTHASHSHDDDPGDEKSPSRPSRSVTFATPQEPTAEPPLVSQTNGDVVMSDADVTATMFDLAPKHVQNKSKTITNGASSGPPQNLAKDRKAKKGVGSVDPVQKLAEDNHKAKMKALHWAESEEDKSGTDTSSSDRPPARSSAKRSDKPMATPKSIFSRPGANGKKIKIVAAKSASAKGKSAQKAANIARRSLGAL